MTARTTGEVLIDADAGTFPFRVEFLDLTKLKTDKYQRKLKPKFLRRAEKNFKPGLVGTPIVARRKNGTEVIIDGKQRWALLTGGDREAKKLGIKGQGIEEWPCVVYEDLTPADEAIMFRDLQRERTGMLSYETFAAELFGGDPVAIALDGAARAIGYEIGPKGETRRTISAVAALRSCYVRAEGEAAKDPSVDPLLTVERTLLIFRQAWADREVPTGWQIRGMHALLLRKPDIDDERMVRRLMLKTSDELNQRANNAKMLAGSTSTSAKFMVEALDRIYAQRETPTMKSAVEQAKETAAV